MVKKKQHPCRKLVINAMDEKILKHIRNNPDYDLTELEELVSMNKIQLKKRLKQLKKHKYI